jgi:hypothetical protein
MSTIEAISNSSDLLWDLLVKVEDCEIDAAEAVKLLSSADDRVIFWECVADMCRKHRAKLAAAEAAAPRDRFYPTKPSPFEEMILAAQDDRLGF